MDITGPIGPLLAFVAGLISVVSPCVLPLVPAYISHLTGTSIQGSQATISDRSYTFRHAVSFVLGFSAVFVVLGASLGLVGFLLVDHRLLLQKIAGAALMFFGLNLAGIIRLSFLARTYQLNWGTGTAAVGRPGDAPAGYSRSLAIGAAFAVGWTPCVGPLLGSILALAASSATVWQGAYLLLFYALGLAVPFLAAGWAVASVRQVVHAVGRYLPAVEVGGGLLMVLFGFLIYVDRVTIFNQYFGFLPQPGL